MKINILCADKTQTLEYEKPALLSELFTKSGIPFDMPCGGRQRCLKCKVIATGGLSPLSEKERELLTDEEKSSFVRFACMTTAFGDVEVKLPAEDNGQIVTKGNMAKIKLEPWGKTLGAAVDIGTTTVAAYLYSLTDARLLQKTAVLNPQASFGSDVISRIEKSLKGQGEMLAEVIRRCITDLLRGLCSAQGLPLSAVDSLVITGNTAMLYLLCGQNPASIATAPFKQDRYFGEFLSSDDLELKELNAKVYLARSVSAYVGGDITTAMLSSGVFASAAPTLLVDIGTNGEMVLHSDGRLLGCSTAAGPAFEGAGITMGMHAVSGAINKLNLSDGRIEFETIGGTVACGICGSGIIDAIAVMLDAGIIDETGCILDEGHGFTDYILELGGKPAFKIPDTNVVITQKDVRSVQLAKSAICAGIKTLLKSAGLGEDKLGQLLIAGGFGSFLNVFSAERIGLIPPGFAAKAVSIGNAAAMGAAMALLSLPQLKRSERLAMETETVELSANPVFSEAYIDGMCFE